MTSIVHLLLNLYLSIWDKHTCKHICSFPLYDRKVDSSKPPISRTHIHIYIYIHIYIHIQTHTHIHIHSHTHTHAHIPTCPYTYTSTHTRHTYFFILIVRNVMSTHHKPPSSPQAKRTLSLHHPPYHTQTKHI